MPKALIAVTLLLAGCYQPMPGVTPALDMHTAARMCQAQEAQQDAGAVALFGALATAPQQFSTLDNCMAQYGWARK